MSLEQRGLRGAGAGPGPGPTKPFVTTERTPRAAIIWALGGLEIRGTVHVPPGLRTMDLLNREAEAFIAVTNATLVLNGGMNRTGFIAVNKAQIVALREMESEE